MNPFIRIIPPPLVKFFARPYVAGDSLQTALDTAAELWHTRGLMATLDLLAEDIESAAQVETNFRTYLEMIERVANDTRFGTHHQRPTLSLKLSSYTTAPLHLGGDARGSKEHVFEIAKFARDRGVDLTIDMESRHWTDYTLKILSELHAAGHTHVGAVIQTRLNRSESDLDRLPPGVRVRLVIGIYNEPSDVALTQKNEMKARMLRFAEILLARGHYVEFGTHDTEWIRRFLAEVVPKVGASREQFEIQLLYGVPRDALLAQLQQEGVRARLYVPFATGWPMAIAYLRRRLDEYPAMMWLVAKNLLAGQ